MEFKTPKVEFVPVDLTMNALDTQSQAGFETCTGPLAPSNLCNYNETFWLDEYGGLYDPSATEP